MVKTQVERGALLEACLSRQTDVGPLATGTARSPNEHQVRR